MQLCNKPLQIVTFTHDARGVKSTDVRPEHDLRKSEQYITFTNDARGVKSIEVRLVQL